MVISQKVVMYVATLIVFFAISEKAAMLLAALMLFIMLRE